MIPKKNRFIRGKAIERVYKQTRPVRAGPFSIRAKKTNIDGYRLAVVVSKKVNKSAVVRNRIRRRVFEYARKNIASSPNAQGKEIIITVFEDSVAADKPESLSRKLEELFDKTVSK